MSESSEERILAAIQQVSAEVQQVNADLQEFKHEVNRKFDKIDQRFNLVDEKINSLNQRLDTTQHVQNLILANVGLVVGVMTLLFTAIQFAVAYFTK